MHTPALTNFELFWEKSLDTKMILAWSKNIVVLAFRGTASMANVVADIQVGIPCFKRQRHSSTAFEVSVILSAV